MSAKRIERAIFKANAIKQTNGDVFSILQEVCLDFNVSTIFLGIFFGEKSMTDSFLLHSNFSKGWEECYLENQCYVHDPIFNRLGKIHFPFEWDTQQTREEIFLQQELMKKTYKFGIHKGTTIPLSPQPFYHGFLTLINHIALHPEALFALFLAANACTEKIIKNKMQEKMNVLSEKELEILSQKSQGLSVKGISRKINVSETTVAFHLANIRKKLGVQTTGQAISTFFTHSGF